MSFDVYLRFAMALGLVIALILILAWAARRAGLGGITAKPAGRKRRLAVVEVLTLDPKRRLVLLRRDGTEHLLILGARRRNRDRARHRRRPSLRIAYKADTV